jgi:small nuclear ribonucleoprotein (snRNP)-like protein
VVTVELKTGEVYRGSMIECEDNWNCQIENITFTAKVHLPLLSPLARIRFSSTHDSDASSCRTARCRSWSTSSSGGAGSGS